MFLSQSSTVNRVRKIQWLTAICLLGALAVSLAGLWRIEHSAAAATTATPTPLPAPSLEHFIPPQQIELSPYAKDVKSGDLDKDGYADLVYAEYSERTLLINGSGQPVLQLQIQVLLNRGGDKTLSQVPQFSAPITLRPVTSSRLDEIRRNLGVGSLDEEAWVNRLKAGGVEIADINGDGLLDLVVWSEAAAAAYIYWNQTGRAGDIFAQAHSNSDTSKQTTLNMPADGHMMPVRCAVADFDGDRMTDLAFYLSTVIQKDGSKYGPKGLQIESLWPVLRKETSPYGFDTTTPMIPIGLGKDVDGIEAGGRLFHHSMPSSADLLPVTGSPFLDAARRVLMSEDGLKVRDVASHPMNTGRVMQVERGKAGAADAVWFSGTGYVRRFVFDAKTKMFRCTQTMQSGGSGMELIGLSDGSLALAMNGGKQIRYGDLATGGKAASSAERSYFLDAGAYLKSVKLGGGMAMLSTLHYQRPGEGVDQVGFDYRALANGQSIESDSLLLIEYIRESSEAGELQVSPLLEGMDRRFVQAIPMKASVDHAPAVVTGEFGAKGEISLGVLESGVLKLYRPNNGAAYTTPTMKIDRMDTATGFLSGLENSGKVAFQGETVVVKGHFPADDPPRYVEMRKGGELRAVLTVSRPVRLGGVDVVSIRDFGGLEVGDDWEMRIWNSNTSVTQSVEIVRPFVINGSDRDGRADLKDAYQACGIMETATGGVWPSQFRVQVSEFPGELEALRLVRISDGAVRNLGVGAGGAKYESGEVIFAVPGDIASGSYRLEIKTSKGYWRRASKTWTVTRGSACSKQVEVINHLARNQGDDTNLYLDPVVGPDGKTYESGAIGFLGSGFSKLGGVKSIALNQGGKRTWAKSMNLVDGRRLNVDWGDLSKEMGEGAVSVEFYQATPEEVEKESIPAVGTIISWRTAKKGKCPSPPKAELTMPISELELGKSVVITGKNLAFPGPEAMKIEITAPDGTKYEVKGFSITEEWWKSKQSNSGAQVKLSLPASLDSYKVETSGAEGGKRAPREAAMTSSWVRVVVMIATSIGSSVITLPIVVRLQNAIFSSEILFGVVYMPFKFPEFYQPGVVIVKGPPLPSALTYRRMEQAISMKEGIAPSQVGYLQNSPKLIDYRAIVCDITPYCWGPLCAAEISNLPPKVSIAKDSFQSYTVETVKCQDSGGLELSCSWVESVVLGLSSAKDPEKVLRNWQLESYRIGASGWPCAKYDYCVGTRISGPQAYEQLERDRDQSNYTWLP